MYAKGQILLLSVTAASGLAGWELRGHLSSASASAQLHSRTQQSTPTWSVSSHDSVRPAWEALVRNYRDEAQQPEAWARLYPMFRDLPKEEFARAIAELSGTGEINGENPGVLLAGMWAERDLPAARAWALGVTSKSDFAQAVFATWARQDLPGMLAWVEANAGQLKPTPTQAGVLAAVAQVAAESDPEQGLQMLDRFAGKAANQEKLALYQNWARIDPAAASERALKEPIEQTSLKALKAVADDWGQSDPQAAAAFARQLPDPRQATAQLMAIADGLGTKDQQGTVAFLYQNSDVSDRLRARAEWRLKLWMREDEIAALRWATEEGPDGALLPALVSASDEARVAQWEKLPPERRAHFEEVMRRLAAAGKANPLE